MSSGQALAHHSFALFDRSKSITLNAVVKEWKWGNPHVWLSMLVTDKDGKVEEWSSEAFGVSMMKRVGWTSTTLNPGDQVTVELYPMKDGTRAGQLVQATLADGKVLDVYRVIEAK